MGNGLQVLSDDGERVLCRGPRGGDDAGDTMLIARPAAEHPRPASDDRLAHEFGLKDELSSAWAVLPVELVREYGRTILVFDDPGGESLERLLGAPMEIGSVLRVAVCIAAALGKLHQRGVVHKNLKPANILVNCTDRQSRLTGFGIASRLPRERQAPEPPETIAGTLAYMAPEQTGRMNRAIDSRSDLYSFGVTLYQMLVGALPFTAADPMEWVHCHIARKPVPPRERLDSVPAPVSGIVMKLLSKTAEERYQTATGVERDLRRCLDGWERQRTIPDFHLGEHDTPDRLLIPEKLYGRAHEVDTLLAAFERVVKGGEPELVLISGYSGIGKSSVVNELQKELVPLRGLFASGKFDQYKRDIPYSTLVQALQSLVRPLLGKGDSELARWRSALLETLGENGRLVTDLVPELRLIIGDLPPVPDLEPQQAQSRFQLVFRRFLGVFAKPEHPLALFLDDLQWLDTATLDLLEDLLIRSDLRHMMLIGAYRDDEVDATHPLARKLQTIKSSGARIAEIALAPLTHEHIGRLVADALHCDQQRATPLAQLVHDKTAGNPFFVIQFLHTLADENLLAFDHDTLRWSWHLDRIHAKGYTENVIGLMVGKLTRLPDDTQQALQQLASLGNVARVAMLSIVLGVSETQIHAALWEALRQELVEQQDGAYKFVHDRIQEAAYSLIPAALRAQTHLRIGRLLAAQTLPEKREETIFDIVHQLNRGASLITSSEEREQLAAANLLAGQRARSSTAYTSALNYLNAGAALLPANSWERLHDLAFALEYARAECEFLTGQLAGAEERLVGLSNCTVTTSERAVVACLRIDVCTALNQGSRAVAICLNYLRHVGIEWSPHPDDEEVQREYKRIWTLLGERTIECLIDLPRMEDPASLASADVLSKALPPAVFMDANLAALITCKAISLSLERGNSDPSCLAYVWFATIAGPRFGDYKAGFRFGELGYDLVERRGLKRFEARTYLGFGVFVVLWMKHVRACRDFLLRAFEAANRIGDLTYAAYACNNLNSNLLFAGEPLSEVQGDAEHGLAFARKARFGLVIDIITTQLALIRMLRGLTPIFGCLDDGEFNELHIERHLAGNPALRFAACLYWIRKIQAHYFSGDHATAVDAASKAQRLLGTSSSLFEEAEYYFYGALAEAAYCDTAAAGSRQQHLDVAAKHHRQLQIWAGNCPENFEDRAALVGAEIARLEGRELDAQGLYEQAIRAAQANGFVHNEALANELAAYFYASRGYEKIARTYLRDASYGYQRWGASGKVQQLEERYPYLRTEESAPSPTSTIATSVGHLDLATVMRVSQAVSGDIVLEKLIDTLMRTAIEQAGAERGLLVQPRAGEQRIVAQATTAGDSVDVRLGDLPVSVTQLPESVLYHVLRTRESVILDDPIVQPPFGTDTYIHQHRPRSLLCLPLMNQSKLIGALFLENTLTPHVFTPTRIAVLRLVASQAAIALENARLYRDLAEREAKIRHLVDANIIGIVVWNFDGEILEANDAFLSMVGYDRDDLKSGKVRWTDLTPQEWRERSEQALEEIRKTGGAQPYEKEYIKKDGSRVPVVIGGTTFEPNGSEGVSFVLDLTERKSAEQEARDSERRYRDVHAELAHANRIATMGQLTATIAHEVRQPIAAMVTNAQAGLRWLTAQHPDVEEARLAFCRIVNDGNRAESVIGRIRDLVKRAPRQKGPVDINEAIRDVIELTQGEARKQGVSVRTQFAAEVPFVDGDRVELEQVLLNLVINAIEAVSAISDSTREVVISAEKSDFGSMLVAVRDSGPGFAQESVERVFTPFYTTKSTGLGMGLSICRSIVEAHGGQLWATSDGHRGAVFQFTVRLSPLSACEANFPLPSPRA